MARETIFPSTPPNHIFEVVKGETVATDLMDWRHCPQVIWTRDHDVQIGIVREDQADSHDGDRLFTGSLDRTQINRLIATLRRARDAAYGADA